MPTKGSGRGVRVHCKGYLQITRRGPWRGWLEHRKVMYEACQEMCYYPLNGDLLPGFTVDHLDHNKQHNCIENLMMLDKRIHDALSLAYWNGVGRPMAMNRIEDRLGAENEEPDEETNEEPDWVTS